MDSKKLILIKNIDRKNYKLLVPSDPSLIDIKGGGIKALIKNDTTLDEAIITIDNAIIDRYTKQEVNTEINGVKEELTKKIEAITGGGSVVTEDDVNKIINKFISSETVYTLNTDNKTIVSAINEIKDSSSGISEDEVNEVITKYINEVEVEGLDTNEKTIVLSINELSELIESKLSSDDANELIKESFSSVENEDLNTNNKTLISAINEVFQSVSNGKKIIASAITDRGVLTPSDATFSDMARNIINIPEPEILTKIRMTNQVSNLNINPLVVGKTYSTNGGYSIGSNEYVYTRSNKINVYTAEYTKKEVE